ncbi:hypothetical protein OS493_005628 [Desmophyllum pertusum]|uniref:Uncharacterized protein n=1 Tax=Desmophyllum pertusum TaxID=174260 RepID=A0A9X0CNU7_9CNID|nr:hypothetical protein OS493_005628 [Desmophyllum pertusum]
MVIRVHQQKKHMMDDAVTFLLRIEGRRTTPVPMPAMADRGVHLTDPTVWVGGEIAGVQLMNLAKHPVGLSLSAYQLLKAEVCRAFQSLVLPGGLVLTLPKNAEV